MPKVERPMGGVSEHSFGASPYFLNSLPNLTDFFIAYRTEDLKLRLRQGLFRLYV